MKRNKEEIQLIKQWLMFAKENLLSAKALIGEDFTPFHTVCFMCQGSAEKYLKAYLLWQRWILKRTHDLSELLNYCGDYDSSFSHLISECQLLNEYITDGRYPGDLPFNSINKQDAQDAIQAAEQIERWVCNKIHFDSNNGENQI